MKTLYRAGNHPAHVRINSDESNIIYSHFLMFQLEKEMATHSSILAWRISWTEEPGGLQSTGLQRVRHDWATSLTSQCFSSGLETENNWICSSVL